MAQPMNCSQCGAPAQPGARFCEYDGTLLTLEVITERTGFGVCRCGASADAIDESGYCSECGVRRTVPIDAGRDHVEIAPSEQFAGVTDRGVRHKENQDDIALKIVPTIEGDCSIAVVCDGVSGSENAAAASAAAAKTACAVIESGIVKGISEALILSAIEAANQTVNSLPYARSTKKDPPETTIVVAVVIGRSAIIGWAGDSRAYWISKTDSSMITRDHSWVNDVVDAGIMTEAEALLSPLAHAIVSSLGGGTEKIEPSVIRCELPEGSRILLCTDGLWNYAPALGDLVEIVNRENDEAPLQTVRRLVRFAIQSGGKDNISAVVLAVE